jgi:hypothetical protein
MVTYTALSPTNMCVVVSVRSLARALELVAVDLARVWVPAHICVGELASVTFALAPIFLRKKRPRKASSGRYPYY